MWKNRLRLKIEPLLFGPVEIPDQNSTSNLGISTGFAKVLRFARKSHQSKRKFNAATKKNLSSQLLLEKFLSRFEISRSVRDFCFILQRKTKENYTRFWRFLKKKCQDLWENGWNLLLTSNWSFCELRKSYELRFGERIDHTARLSQKMKILRGFLYFGPTNVQNFKLIVLRAE